MTEEAPKGTQVEVKYVIAAQEKMLAEKDSSIIMLTALVNQQQAELAALKEGGENAEGEAGN